MGRSITSRRGRLPAPSVFANDQNLTQFSGLVPLIKFLTEKLRIPDGLSRVAGSDTVRRIHAVHLVLFGFLVGSLAGSHRLAHLEWLQGDAVLGKFLRLTRWPVRKVFASALAGVTDQGVAKLVDLIAAVGLAPVHGLASAVVDIDSSAVVTYGTQEGARFGYSGKGRNRRRHHPLVASVGENRAVVHADYRTGAGIPATEAIAFASTAIARVQAVLVPGGVVTLRADSGFWSKAMGAWLLDAQQAFIFSMPLQPGLKLLLRTTRWQGLDGDDDVQVTTLRGEVVGIDPRLRVVGIRRRVADPAAPPQGKEIAGCTGWRYQALVTATEGPPEDLWRFYNGRADCERVFKVARGALGMGHLVGQSLRANETAFLLRLLAFNADLRFQEDVERAATEAGRPMIRMGLLARQRRFYTAAGRLLRAQGRWVLRVRDNPRVAAMWAYYAPQLVARE